jgi:hypothetical protein
MRHLAPTSKELKLFHRRLTSDSSRHAQRQRHRTTDRPRARQPAIALAREFLSQHTPSDQDHDRTPPPASSTERSTRSNWTQANTRRCRGEEHSWARSRAGCQIVILRARTRPRDRSREISISYVDAIMLSEQSRSIQSPRASGHARTVYETPHDTSYGDTGLRARARLKSACRNHCAHDL